MNNGTITGMIGTPIGPLLPSEWAEFCQRNDDRELLQCCGTTSDFRDAVFDLLRAGDTVLDHKGRVIPALVTGFRAAYWDMVDHPLPSGRGGELIDRLARYYLGDPPLPASDIDRMHGDQVYAELCNLSGQPTVNARPSRFSVCGLPEMHRHYGQLVVHVDLRRVDPDDSDRWTVRWRSYVHNADTREWDIATISDGADVDDWREKHEFRLAYAMDLAQALAVTVDVNGRTAADIIAADLAAAGEKAVSRLRDYDDGPQNSGAVHFGDYRRQEI